MRISPASSRAFSASRDDAEFLTALRACWAALWTTNARRSMAQHGLDPAGTAMAVLVQPLVAARASGGGLSETADGQMLSQRHLGTRLGDRPRRSGARPHRAHPPWLRAQRTTPAASITAKPALHGAAPAPQAVPDALVSAPCLEAGQATTLGRLMRKAEDVLGMPVEIEWALDDAGFKLLQARPLHVEPAQVPDEIWLKHPGLNGHPAGIGWGSGRAVVVNCECELSRVAPGDILVTRVAGPALSHILPRVGGVVAELGGSTSHLASLARERGIPDGARRARRDAAHSRRRPGRGRRRRRRRAVARLMARHPPSAHFRDPAGRPNTRSSACARWRGVNAICRFEPDHSQAHSDRRSAQGGYPVLPVARQDRPRRHHGQSEFAPDRSAIDHAVQYRRRDRDGAAHSRHRHARRSPPKPPPISTSA